MPELVGDQASKFGFYKLIEYIIKKKCHGVQKYVPFVKQNVIKLKSLS